MSAYQTLERRFARLAAINDALGILQWDTETLMPPGAADGRAEQLATLKVLSHELLTDDDNADLLADAEHETELSDWQEANLHEMRRAYLHATAVPGDLVEANSRAVSRCEMVWRDARPAGDFAMLLPSLSEVLNLQRQIAAAKAEALGCSLYEALLDTYEPGGNTDHIDKLFGDLKAFLPGFLDEVLERQKSRPDILPLQGPFPVETQRALGVRLMQAPGFDFNRGRLDISLHPFCGGATHDVRLTTRYDEDDFTKALMGVLHETGHALYEQNRPAEWLGQPVSEARGMSLHESQSLIIEMQACRSRAFLEFAAPVMRDSLRRDGTGLGRRQPAPAVYQGRTGLHPGRCRRGDIPRPYPDPLRSGKGADRGRHDPGRPARRLERGHARPAGPEGHRPTGSAAFRTSTGRAEPGAIFPHTRWEP